VSGPSWRGRDAFVEGAKSLFDTFPSATFEPRAVRGDRLVLVLGRVAAPDGFEMINPSVFEVDATGALVYWATFDADDVALAFDELEDRYCAGEGADSAYVIRRSGDLVRAFHRRDWAAYEALFTPNCVAVDHRRLGRPLSDRASVVTMLRDLVDVAPDAVHISHTLNVRGGAGIAYMEAAGTTPEGNRYSSLYYAVGQSVAGRSTYLELFDLDQRAEAHARFEEFAAETRTPDVDNLAVRSAVRGVWPSEP
jgi:hypothetical protein